MFKPLAIVLFCVLNSVFSELNLSKLTNDCLRNTLDNTVKSCSISNNFSVYNLHEGSSTFRCLTYNRDPVDENFDIFTLKVSTPFNLHYTGAVIRSNDSEQIEFKIFNSYTARFAIYSNDSKFRIKEVLVNQRVVEKDWSTAECSHLTCGKQAVRSNDLTKFGLNSNPGDFPWAVAIFQKHPHDTNKYKCGGSIIAARHIITSVNCLLDEGRLLSTNEVTVHVARYSLESQSQFSRIYDINKVVPHDGFDFHLNNNIAMLLTRSNIEFSDYVMPICLPKSQNVVKDALGKLVGFGKISSDSDPKSKFLAVAEYSVTESSNCLDNKLSDFNTTKYFCAENNSGNIRISDLGSGLYFNKTNTWFIGGIVSRPSTIPCDNNYILFTNIQPYIPWIQSTSTKSN